MTWGDDKDAMNGDVVAAATPWSMLRRAARYWRGAAVVFALALVATAGLVWTSRPVFKSESVLLYRTGARQGYGEELDPARRAGARLQDMLFSRERFATIVREMHLHPGVDPREAAEEMIKGTAFRVRDGSTFGIGFEAEDPAVAQEVTRRLGDSLIADNARQRRQEADEHKVFLDQEKLRAEDAVRVKEAALADFLYNHPSFAARAAQPGALGVGPADTGGDDGGRALEIEMQIEELRAQLATAATAPSLPAPALRGSPQLVVARARAEQELAEAEKQLAETSQRFTEEHPDVRAATARVQHAKAEVRRIAAQMDATVPGSPVAKSEPPSTPAASLERRIRLLEAQLAESRRRARPLAPVGQKTAVATEVEWQRVSREVTEAREKLAKLGDRQFQADLLATLESSGQAGLMVVVDPAYRPVKPTRNPRPKVAGGGLFAALLLAFGWAGLRAVTDDRLFDGADVTRLTSSPVLTVVPRGLLLEGSKRG